MRGYEQGGMKSMTNISIDVPAQVLILECESREP